MSSNHFDSFSKLKCNKNQRNDTGKFQRSLAYVKSNNTYKLHISL